MTIFVNCTWAIERITIANLRCDSVRMCPDPNQGQRSMVQRWGQPRFPRSHRPPPIGPSRSAPRCPSPIDTGRPSEKGKESDWNEGDYWLLNEGNPGLFSLPEKRDSSFSGYPPLPVLFDHSIGNWHISGRWSIVLFLLIASSNRGCFFYW